MKKLYILGDSFSYPHKTEKKLWPVITGEYLEQQLKEKVEIVNLSLIGASQDYVWKKLDHVLEQITQDDYLVIVLTSSDRFWYIENRPEFSNLGSVKSIIHSTEDAELQNAIWGFLTKIWRNSLAQQLQDHRLGYLCYHVLSKKLKKPIILKGFEEILTPLNKYNEIIFSKNSLAKIQLEEFSNFEGVRSGDYASGDILMDEKYWHHVDCRYNHMCLSNHKILGSKLGDSLLTGGEIDLGSNEFYKGIITPENCKNNDLAAKEFSVRYFKEMLNNKLRQDFGAKSVRLFF